MTKKLTRQDLDDLLTSAQRLHTVAAASLGIINTAADYGFPTTASTAPIEPANQTDDDGQPVKSSSRPEALAIAPDRTAQHADAIIKQVAKLNANTYALLRLVQAFEPDRNAATCSRCNSPLDRNATQCRRVFDGRPCGECWSKDKGGCGRIMERLEKLRHGYCDACTKRRGRHAAKKATTTAANRGTGTIDVMDTAGMMTTDGSEA